MDVMLMANEVLDEKRRSGEKWAVLKLILKRL